MSTRKTLLLGVDQGTTNTKAVLVDTDGNVVAEVSRPIATVNPAPGVVEQDAAEMLANVRWCIAELAGARQGIAGMGISTQTETLVVWDRKSGEPVMPAMVWQCRRGAAEIENLKENEGFIRERTGLGLDPTFTAAKLRWVFANRPAIAEGLRQGNYLWGTVDCWLCWKLSGGAVWRTEPSCASRTMLFDINKMQWDPELLDVFDLKLQMPEIGPTAGRHAEAEIPITAMMGDQQASLFGHGCFSEGDAKITYGTGAFAWINRGNHCESTASGLIRTIAWALSMERPVYAVEGFVMSAGAVLDWLAARFSFNGAAQVAELAGETRTSEGVFLVPAFQGLAAPWWNSNVRAMLSGMTPATTRGHLAHSALESVAYQVAVLLEEMGTPATLSVDGGLTRSRYFLELQAGILGVALARASVQAASPYGAALMAGIGAGIWENPEQLRPLIRHEEPLRPAPAASGLALWRRWVEATIALAETGAS